MEHRKRWTVQIAIAAMSQSCDFFIIYASQPYPKEFLKILNWLSKKNHLDTYYFAFQFYYNRILGRYAPLILAPAECFSLEPCL